MDTTRLQRLSSAVSRHDPEPDQYLTDGRKLFRVVVLRVFNEEELVELEDCATLDIWLVSPDLGSPPAAGAPVVAWRRARGRDGLAFTGPLVRPKPREKPP